VAYTSASGERCARHDTPIDALHPCERCFDDPPPPIDADEEVCADPEFAAHEAWCIAGRDFLFAMATDQQSRREDNESQDRIGAATVAKLMDGALKYERTALELAKERKDKERKAKLLAEYKALKGVH